MGDRYRPSRLAGAMSSEGKSIDDIVSRNALAQLRRDPLPRHPPTEARRGAGDIDIVASMAKRLSVIERELKDKTFLMHAVQAENEVLKSKLKAAEEEMQRKAMQHSSSAAPSSSHSSASEDGGARSRSDARLRAQLRYAWKQVTEMKQFLSDYGLVWVGEPDTEGLGEPAAGSSPAHREGDGAAAAACLPPHPPVQDRSAAGAGPRRRSSGGVPPPQPPPSTSSSHLRGGPASSPAPQGLPFALDRLMSAVSELNQIAGDGEGRLVDSEAGHGAKLHTPDPIRLVLFSDGLQVHRSQPRAYDDAVSKGVLKDVLDGYFPIVLKKEFPDGVPIKVIDRTSVAMASAAGASSAAAAAAARGGGGSNVRSFQDIEEDQSAPVPRDKFLRQLPQTVIKNGKVIEIRSEVGKLVGAPPAPGEKTSMVALVSTPTDALLTTSQRNHKGPNLPPPSRDMSVRPPAGSAGPDVAAAGTGPLSQLPQQRSAQQEIATLQVKSEDGKQTFILKLQYDETVFALRKYIDAHREKLGKEQGKAVPAAKSYEIRSAFPARAYTEAKETLREAGLVPNSTLFLKAI